MTVRKWAALFGQIIIIVVVRIAQKRASIDSMSEVGIAAETIYSGMFSFMRPNNWLRNMSCEALKCWPVQIDRGSWYLG